MDRTYHGRRGDFYTAGFLDDSPECSTDISIALREQAHHFGVAID